MDRPQPLIRLSVIIPCAVLSLIFIGSFTFLTKTISESPFITYQLKTFFYIRGTAPHTGDLILIKIDDPSWEHIKNSRKGEFIRVLTKALKRLEADSPRLVLLDLYFRDNPEIKEDLLALAEQISKLPVGLGYLPVPALEDSDKPSTPSPEILSAARFPLSLYVSVNKNEYAINLGLLDKETLSVSFPFLEVLKEVHAKEFETPSMFDLINYYGHPGTIKSYSILDLITEGTPASNFSYKDKVIVIGGTSEKLEKGHIAYDLKNVPVWSPIYGFQMDGVEVQATILGNLLGGDWIKKLPHTYEGISMFFIAFCAIYLMINTTIPKAFLITLTTAALWFSTAFIAFYYYSYFVTGVFRGILCLFIVFLFLLSYKFVRGIRGTLVKQEG